MKSSNKWARKIREVARAATIVVLAVTIGGISITPVLAEDGRRDHERKGGHERKVQHERRGHDRYDGRGYYETAPVYYAPPQPVYAPPGVSIVFPIHIR